MDIIDQRTGVWISSKEYINISLATPNDIVVNHLGIFILANIQDGFQDSSSQDSYLTQNSAENFAIIFADYEGNIVEIESYDPTEVTNALGAPYPKKLVIGRRNKQAPIFSFISSRNNAGRNQGGGIYISQIADQQAFFIVGSTNTAWASIDPSWTLCHLNGCFECLDGFKIQEGVWKLTWEGGFYHEYDDSDNSKDIDICLPCHESCLTCSNASERSCTSCESDKIFNAVKGTCTWDSSGGNQYLSLNGQWVSSCGDELTGIKQGKWYRGCPEDSDDFKSKINLSTVRTKSSQINCQDLTRHLYVIEGVTEKTQLSFGFNQQSESHSLMLWLRPFSTSFQRFPIMFQGKFLSFDSINFRIFHCCWFIRQHHRLSLQDSNWNNWK